MNYYRLILPLFCFIVLWGCGKTVEEKAIEVSYRQKTVILNSLDLLHQLTRPVSKYFSYNFQCNSDAIDYAITEGYIKKEQLQGAYIKSVTASLRDENCSVSVHFIDSTEIPELSGQALSLSLLALPRPRFFDWVCTFTGESKDLPNSCLKQFKI